MRKLFIILLILTKTTMMSQHFIEVKNDTLTFSKNLKRNSFIWFVRIDDMQDEYKGRKQKIRINDKQIRESGVFDLTLFGEMEPGWYIIQLYDPKGNFLVDNLTEIK